MSKSSSEILERATTIAVVGASRDANKAGGSVPAGLQQRGFRIIPINPFADTLFGERVYRSLSEVPVKIDIVDVFRPSQEAPDLARQAVDIGAKVFWCQLGVISEEAAGIARGKGLEVVMDRCCKIEHARFFGGLRTIGLNTGVVTSRLAMKIPEG